jgi:hypothetical protein
MRVILSGRKTSRTTQLIELCAETERNGKISYIVCHSHEAAYAIKQKAMEMNLDIRFPITFAEFMSGLYAGQRIKNFFFDNADMFLQSLTPVHIAAVVFEKEKENEDASLPDYLDH